ncbi:putative amino-acid metabolite efflux pump [Sporomusa rhizae]|uniref:DMT family transporter n=1 Tax=Sporomusa rhizae TaxID=357999 RepID=UPI00352B00C5
MVINKDMAIYLSLTCVAFLWGTSFAISKIALYELSPLNLAGFRFFIAAILFGIILAIKRAGIHKEDIPQLVIMGFLSITSYFYIQYTGLLYTTSINAALLLATSPVWTTIASVVLGQEKVNRNSVVGMLIAFLGVSLVISRGKLFSLFASETIFGDLLLLLNAIVWAIFTLYGKKIMTKYSPFTAVGYITIFGAVMLLPVILVPNQLNPVSLLAQIADISLQTLAAVLYLAVLCSVYAYYTWYHGIEKIGAVRTASFYYVSPLFALLAGIWLLKETVTFLVLLGGIAVIGGVYLTNKSKCNGMSSKS